jgi:hypothetical protein
MTYRCGIRCAFARSRTALGAVLGVAEQEIRLQLDLPLLRIAS